MLAWVTIDRQHKSYLSPIFARAIHKGNWDENSIGWHEFCVVLMKIKVQYKNLCKRL